jgi:hypothetical protein
MKAVEELQADFLARIETLGNDQTAERRLQAMASPILVLVRDKGATLDTALAGLDQLRARLRVLEQMGDFAEARGLFERQAARLEAAEVKLAGLEAATPPFAEISEQMSRLYDQRDAMAETVFARLAPLEARQRELEAMVALRDPQAGLDRLAERLEAVRAAQEAAATALGGSLGRPARLRGGGRRGPARHARRCGGHAGRPSRGAGGGPERDRRDRRAAGRSLRPEGGGDGGGPRPARAAGGRLGDIETKLAASHLGASWSVSPNGWRPPARRRRRRAPCGGRLDGVAATTEARLLGLASETGTRLATLEQAAREDTGAEAEAETARMQAQAIAVQLVAARTVAEETRLFANRLALLEASLPRLSMAQALMMQARERQSAPQTAPRPLAEEAPLRGGAAEDAAWRLPRVILGQKT